MKEVEEVQEQEVEEGKEEKDEEEGVPGAVVHVHPVPQEELSLLQQPVGNWSR